MIEREVIFEVFYLYVFKNGLYFYTVGVGKVRSDNITSASPLGRTAKRNHAGKEGWAERVRGTLQLVHDGDAE